MDNQKVRGVERRELNTSFVTAITLLTFFFVYLLWGISFGGDARPQSSDREIAGGEITNM